MDFLHIWNLKNEIDCVVSFFSKFKFIKKFIIFRIECVFNTKNLIENRRLYFWGKSSKGKMIKNMITRYSGWDGQFFGRVSYRKSVIIHCICKARKKHDEFASFANKLCAYLPKNEFYSIEMFIANALV